MEALSEIMRYLKDFESAFETEFEVTDDTYTMLARLEVFIA